MAQKFRVLAVLLNDLDSVPSAQMATQNHLQSQFREVRCPLRTPTGTRHACGAYTYMQAKHSQNISFQNNNNINAQKG